MASDRSTHARLDPAPAGDIRGAFGTIREHEEAHRGLRSRAAGAAGDHRSRA